MVYFSKHWYNIENIYYILGERRIMIKKIIKIITLFIYLFSICIVPGMAKASDYVYVVPINGTIDPGLASFVERIYDEAEENGVTHIILEIDTYGGRIDAAIRIKERILASSIPTVSFVTKKAISAGALITLAGEKIAMAPATTIGAAEPRIGSKKADEKVLSMWRKTLADTAETRGRDGQIAAAMADADIEIPGLVQKGKLLTLTRNEALEQKYADFSAANREEVLEKVDLDNAKVIEVFPSMAETVARWVTHPYISPILLTVGVAGMVLEFFTLGWGVAGTIGLVSLAFFFGGHIIAGLTGWGAVLLFIMGVLLLLVEAFLIPGFGLAGIGGVIAMVVSIVLTSASVEQAIISLVIAFIGTIGVIALSFRYAKTRSMWNRLILGVKQEKNQGYVAPQNNLHDLLGLEGITLTPLRPAGAAEINGLRVDVVTEGGFIPRETKIKVTQIEGTRVIVRRIQES